MSGWTKAQAEAARAERGTIFGMRPKDADKEARRRVRNPWWWLDDAINNARRALVALDQHPRFRTDTRPRANQRTPEKARMVAARLRAFAAEVAASADALEVTYGTPDALAPDCAALPAPRRAA